MDKFNLFNLVQMQNNQQYLEASSIHETTMYTLYNSPINNNIIKKNHHDSNKNRTVKLINYSAKNYTDIKHGLTKLSTTLISSKKVPLRTAIFNKFIQELENQFTFSNYLSDIFTSNTFSSVTFISLSENDISNFDTIGIALYAYNPIYGIVVTLLFINSNYQGKNIGSTLLDMLQKFTWTFLHSTLIFACVINNKDCEPLSFYRKLRFHPANSSCYSFEDTFPSTIINAINNIDSLEYLLERNKIKYSEK